MLGLIGWGEVQVVDPDAVERTNLTRSTFFRTAGAMGRNKAETIVEAARDLFPDTQWICRPVEIADLGFQHLAGQDLLFSCVDSELARLEIACIGAKLDIPCADAGTGGGDCSSGRVAFFPGRSGACICCSLTPQTRRYLLAEWTAPRRPCWAEEASEDEALPSTPTMAAVVGSLQVELALRRLDHRADGAVAWEIAIGGSPGVEEVSIAVNRLCPFHEADTPVLEPVDNAGMSVREFLSRTASGGRSVLVLDWPVCVAARCERCGHRWRPMRRLAVARSCPNCGETAALRMRSIHHIDSDSEFAGCRLNELGVPDRHLCTVTAPAGVNS